MDLEKIAEASHQAWFVAMAKQGWIFGPRLNPDFKTHPWLKPYGGLADHVAVMFRGKIVEYGETHAVLSNPQHPYTKALIECIPQPGQKRPRLTTIDHAALETAV